MMFFVVYILPWLVYLLIGIVVGFVSARITTMVAKREARIGWGPDYEAANVRTSSALIVLGLGLAIAFPLYLKSTNFQNDVYWIVASIFWGGEYTSLGIATLNSSKFTLAWGLFFSGTALTILFLVDFFGTPSIFINILRLVIFALLVLATICISDHLLFRRDKKRANISSSSSQSPSTSGNRAAALLGVIATLVGLVSSFLDVLTKFGLWPLGH